MIKVNEIKYKHCITVKYQINIMKYSEMKERKEVSGNECVTCIQILFAIGGNFCTCVLDLGPNSNCNPNYNYDTTISMEHFKNKTQSKYLKLKIFINKMKLMKDYQNIT